MGFSETFAANNANIKISKFSVGNRGAPGSPLLRTQDIQRLCFMSAGTQFCLHVLYWATYTDMPLVFGEHFAAPHFVTGLHLALVEFCLRVHGIIHMFWCQAYLDILTFCLLGTRSFPWLDFQCIAYGVWQSPVLGIPGFLWVNLQGHSGWGLCCCSNSSPQRGCTGERVLQNNTIPYLGV